MKVLSGILCVLLAISLWFNFRQPKPIPPNTEEPPSEPQTESPTGPQLLQVIHLDDPIPSVERFYNLFPGTILDQLFVGNINPSSDTAAQITKALGLPLTSGKDVFPAAKIDSFVQNSPNGKFIHFANLTIGSNKLGFGSTQTTPCTFPGNDVPTEPIGQVIPWFKVSTNASQTFEKGTALGFQSCGSFIAGRNEGFLIDPAGFLVLIQGPPPGK